MASHIRRRKLLAMLLGGGAATWPLAARAQQPAKPPIIGFLGAATPSTTTPWIAAFVQRLREFGWVEGRNIVIEYRWAEGRTKRYAEIAAEFVRIKVDVIVTHSTAPVVAANQATAAEHTTSACLSFGRLHHPLHRSGSVSTTRKAIHESSSPSISHWHDKLYTLGKDNLARISGIMMRYALARAAVEKNEKGEPCVPHWPNNADEMRFLRFIALALAVLDKAATALAPQVAALKADDKLYTLGKDNLARISGIMMRYALAHAAVEKNEKGEPCVPHWPNNADDSG